MVHFTSSAASPAVSAVATAYSLAFVLYHITYHYGHDHDQYRGYDYSSKIINNPVHTDTSDITYAISLASANFRSKDTSFSYGCQGLQPGDDNTYPSGPKTEDSMKEQETVRKRHDETSARLW